MWFNTCEWSYELQDNGLEENCHNGLKENFIDLYVCSTLHLDGSRNVLVWQTHPFFLLQFCRGYTLCLYCRNPSVIFFSQWSLMDQIVASSLIQVFTFRSKFLLSMLSLLWHYLTCFWWCSHCTCCSFG